MIPGRVRLLPRMLPWVLFAAAQAGNPALIGLARAAAKDAVRQNLTIPLQVAGFGAVSVTLRFDGDAAP